MLLRASTLAALALASCTSDFGPQELEGVEYDDESSVDAGPAAPDYRSIAERFAGVPLDDTSITVIGLRGFSVDQELHLTASTREYDDTFVVLSPRAPVVLAGATHPWETSSSQSPDADGDRVGDVGMIRPGHYRATARPATRDIAGRPTYAVSLLDGSGFIPGWRDTDHDGVFSPEEVVASQRRGDHLSAILFHQGGEGAPPAIGCQVMAARDFERFVDAVGGPGATFDVIIVDAHSVDSLGAAP